MWDVATFIRIVPQNIVEIEWLLIEFYVNINDRSDAVESFTCLLLGSYLKRMFRRRMCAVVMAGCRACHCRSVDSA